jgi:hypothetical protein
MLSLASPPAVQIRLDHGERGEPCPEPTAHCAGWGWLPLRITRMLRNVPLPCCKIDPVRLRDVAARDDRSSTSTPAGNARLWNDESSRLRLKN